MQCVILSNMVDFKPSGLVGTFIKQRRQLLGLSQRNLGQMLNPQVTMQFISNLERGVTPLPASHIPTLCQALKVDEQELTHLLEKEFSLKLSKRMGKTTASESAETHSVEVAPKDAVLMASIYKSFTSADENTRQIFLTFCQNVLGISK